MASKALSIRTAKNPAKNPEIIRVAKSTDQVSCNGGHPVLGHPLTYYSFDGNDVIDCGYCDRQFVRRMK